MSERETWARLMDEASLTTVAGPERIALGAIRPSGPSLGGPRSDNLLDILDEMTAAASVVISARYAAGDSVTTIDVTDHDKA